MDRKQSKEQREKRREEARACIEELRGNLDACGNNESTRAAILESGVKDFTDIVLPALHSVVMPKTWPKEWDDAAKIACVEEHLTSEWDADTTLEILDELCREQGQSKASRKRFVLNPPKRDWLIPGWLPANRLTLLTGSGGVGKSRLVLQIAIALASSHTPHKQRWLTGKGVPDKGQVVKRNTPYKVVVAGYEDELDEVNRRIVGILNPPGEPPSIEPDDVLDEHLEAHHPDGALWEAHEYVTNAPGLLSDAGKYTRAVCEDIGASLFVIDPAAAGFSQNENDRALVRRFLEDFNEWAQATSCAVVVVAHPPKSGALYSGSTDWHNGARNVLVLRERSVLTKYGREDTSAQMVFEEIEGTRASKRLTEQDKKNGLALKYGIALESVKCNYGKQPERLWLRGFPLWEACTLHESENFMRAQRGVGPEAKEESTPYSGGVDDPDITL